jgi:citrate synthase
MHGSSASTSICHYTAAEIFVRDRNLCTELIGSTSLTDYLYLLIMRAAPTEAQRAIVEAALITIAEHGLTPSVIAARLTYMGAPESFQGAVAAGLLGVGDQFVGTIEQIAPLLVEITESSAGAEAAARTIVARFRNVRALMPGFGQPHHKPDDPRTPALFAVGERYGVNGRFVAALKTLSAAVDEALGRHLTINAPAAIASLFLEIGVPVGVMRGFVLIARCIGLVGHLAEEQSNPAGRMLWDAAARSVDYVPATKD